MNRDKLLGENFVINAFEQMTIAVHIIHTMNIVHADLKPANFMVVGQYIKLIDFGLSRQQGPDESYIIHEVGCGTKYFMSPETRRTPPRKGKVCVVIIYCCGF